MVSNNIIGQRIKERREQLNISALEIAEATGLSKATIHRYENGEIKKIKLPIIESIAQILKVNPAWLIGKSEDKFSFDTLHIDINERDIKKVLSNLTDYIASKDNLTYNDKPITPELRLSLISNLEAVIKITDKILEK